MIGNSFDEKVASLGRKVAVLQRDRNGGPVDDALAVALSELQASFEELQVAQEEMRQQNESILQARDVVDEERRRYQDMFDFAPDAYVVTDRYGTIRESNRAATRLLNKQHEYLLGRPLVIFVHPDDRTRFRNFVSSVSQRDVPAELVLTLKTRRASGVEAQLHAAAIRDRRGDAQGIRWLIRDISEQQRRERDALVVNEELERRVSVRTRELEETVRRLETATRAKDEFLGLMSHELKTPITTIYGNAQVLRNRDRALTSEDRRAAIADIEDEAERLHRVIENLLVLSRIDASRRPETEPVLLQHVLGEVLHRRQRATPHRRIDLSIEPDLPPVAAEPTYVDQVIENLISNADKYSPFVKPIEVELRREDGTASLRVLDRGSGIDPDEIDRVFDAFYRSPRTAAEAGGTGIGLSVCKRLIEAQGGSIWANPRDGGGTEVGFSLPIEEATPD